MKDDRSIEDLCKPLSAKVQPASAMYSAGGRKMSATVAAGAARQSRRQLPQKGKPKDPARAG